MTPMPNPPDAPCCGYYGPDTPCACGTDERVMRAYMSGNITILLSVEQREWCVAQIRRASDATPQPDSFDGHSDKDLASATYWSWVDYCRDKGIAP